MSRKQSSLGWLCCRAVGLMLCVVAAVAAAAGDTCEDFSPTGIDYADENITVVPGGNPDACCDACGRWNRENATSAATTCYISVWHNVKGEEVCSLKASAKKAFKGHLVLAVKAPPTPKAFRFSSIYTDGMVLQSAPQRAQVWGFCHPSETGVTVAIDGTTVNADLVTTEDTCRWYAMLPATAASTTSHTLVATPASNATLATTLTDVLFGDVWVCSGQSNMAYALNGSNGHELVHPPVNDSAHEVPDMVNYPYIRFFRAGELLADHPTAELAPASQGGEGRPPVVQWSKPCPTGEASSCRVDFSNMCWFFGRNVQAALAQRAADAIDGEIRPIGLIGTYVGGTADELWSSKDALRKCLDPNKPIPTKDSQLWNGMVNPILNTTIKGAIWYQGEADAGHPGGQYDAYNCTFPAMIADWREKWHASTHGETARDFPFGFVQLNSIGNGSTFDHPVDPSDNADGLSAQFGYAGLRWSQTAAHGFVPNAAQPNVFMATSLDTPDRPYKFTGSNGVTDDGFNVHSPFKQPVAARLARAGLAQAYNVSVETVGPLFQSVRRVNETSDDALVELTGCGASGGVLPVQNTQGFEALVPGGAHGASVWEPVPVIAHAECSVTVGGAFGRNATKLRYNWYSNPCGVDCFGCAVYVAVEPLVSPPLSGMEQALPLPPFVTDLA